MLISTGNGVFMFICSNPFERAEIDGFGDIYNCCKFHLPIKMGNIYENSFEEIWNSESAQKIRQNVLNGDYSMCNKDCCCRLINFENPEEMTTIPEVVMQKGPKHVSFCYDKECNIACTICRDEIWRNTDEELKVLNDKIQTLFLPMLKDTELVTINAHGDAFGSRHSRLLIKEIKKAYPNIKFEIFTNGILCNEYNLKDLNIIENIKSIQISIHSCTKEIYSKIVRNGELYFDSLMKNLKYISELKKQYGFEFMLFFVTTAENYTDIAGFVELATNLGAKPAIWEYRDEQLQSENKHPERVIVDKNHPLHKNLVEVLNRPIMKTAPFVGLSPLLRQIQNEKDD